MTLYLLLLLFCNILCAVIIAVYFYYYDDLDVSVTIRDIYHRKIVDSFRKKYSHGKYKPDYPQILMYSLGGYVIMIVFIIYFIVITATKTQIKLPRKHKIRRAENLGWNSCPAYAYNGKVWINHYRLDAGKDLETAIHIVERMFNSPSQNLINSHKQKYIRALTLLVNGPDFCFDKTNTLKPEYLTKIKYDEAIRESSKVASQRKPKKWG